MKRKLFLLLIVCLLMGNLTACSSNCKVSGCDKEIYRDGLCSKHAFDESIYKSNQLKNELDELYEKLDDVNDKLGR